MIINGKGLPNTDTLFDKILSLYGKRGDLRLQVDVDFPIELNDKQKEIIKGWSDDMFSMPTSKYLEDEDDEIEEDEDITVDDVQLDIDE